MPARKTLDSELFQKTLCRVHGLIEKERTQRTARREIKAGTITQLQFDQWRWKHYPPKKRKWTEG